MSIDAAISPSRHPAIPPRATGPGCGASCGCRPCVAVRGPFIRTGDPCTLRPAGKEPHAPAVATDDGKPSPASVDPSGLDLEQQQTSSRCGRGKKFYTRHPCSTLQSRRRIPAGLSLLCSLPSIRAPPLVRCTLACPRPLLQPPSARWPLCWPRPRLADLEEPSPPLPSVRRCTPCRRVSVLCACSAGSRDPPAWPTPTTTSRRASTPEA